MTTTITPAAKPAQEPCHCGCGAPSECCELECLVHPRFFCGQVLADQDLTALVDWIKNKTGLARFRHGWGVVCGLEVHCGSNGSVTVAPGYAMDCCGRDVVLCKEATFDLTPCWKRSPSACSTLPPAQTPQGETAAQGDLSLGGFTVPRKEVQVFDVMVRYAESQSDARTALARGGCGGTAPCEYTRVHEGYEIYCSPANGCEDPNEREFVCWKENYRADLERKLDELANLKQITGSRLRLQSIIEYQRKARSSNFCFLTDWLCDLYRLENLPENWDRDLYFWIFQDWRNAYFRTPCKGCGPDTGIRLARVWLWMRKDNGREVFTTLFINSYAPFRRTLANDTWPASAGGVNLAPYIWAPADSALRPLEQMGFTIQRHVLTSDDLFKVADREVMAVRLPENGHLTVYEYPDPCGQGRIVCIIASHHLVNAPIAVPKDPVVAPAPVVPPPAAPVAPPVPIDPDDPRLALQTISGIGPASDGKLKEKNIRNIQDLAQATPDEVRAALAGIPAPKVDELIESAKNIMKELTKI